MGQARAAVRRRRVRESVVGVFRRSVGARIGGTAALLLLLLAVVAAVALQGFGRARGRAPTGSRTTARSTELAGTARFRTADFAGWQTGYAFDVARGVPDAASDGVGQRKEFLASTAAFAADLDAARRGRR